MKHYWVVRFDYEQVVMRGDEPRPCRITARLGVVAASVSEAIDAVRSKEAEYPKAVIWGASHQGRVEMTV